MPTDYPDGFRRNLPGHTVDLESGFSLPWCESTSLTISAAADSSFTVNFSSAEWIYFVDMINVTPQAYTEFYMTVAVNGVLYTAGAGMGFLIIPLRTNPSINFIASDSISVTVTNKDSSSRTFKVMINGSKILRPSTYGKVPGALFSASPLCGIAPLTVAFTDESSYDPDSWEWRVLGDDIDSTDQNPSVVLPSKGYYSPSLKASNCFGQDTYARSDYIVVADVCAIAAYTKVDPNSRYSGLSFPVTITNITMNENAYIYYDFGASYFNGYCILSSAKITGGDTGGHFEVPALSNAVPCVVAGGGLNVTVEFYKSGASTYALYLKLMNGVTDVVTDTMAITVNTYYYFKLVHEADSTTITLYVYSDSAYSTLVDTLVITNASCATKFRYLSVSTSFNNGSSYKASGVISSVGIVSP